MSALLNTLATLGTGRLITMAVVGAVLLGFFAVMGNRLSQPTMTLLYSDLSPEDSAEIVDRLDASSTPYDLRGNGTQIYVPQENALRLRMDMAADGIPSGGSIGYEIFDRGSSLGTTSFVQNINRLRALEGELARTIRSFEQVQSARVHLVLPTRQVFQREQRKPTASIVVKTRLSSLTQSQVRAIQNLTAAAVPDLDPARVSIVDDRGNLLSRLETSADAMSAANLAEMRIATENRLRVAVESLVEQSVGYGRVRAQVSAIMNFDRITENSEIFDPDGQVVRSSQTTEEISESNESERDNTVTVENNLPDANAEEQAGTNSNNRSNRTDETVNYEISKKLRTEVRESGGIEKLSVAVLVDGRYAVNDQGEQEYAARDQAELQQIEALVKSAIGFDEERGDTIEVVNMRFARGADALEEEIVEEGFLASLSTADYLRIGELVAFALIALLTLLLVARPLIKKVIQPPQENTPPQTVPLLEALASGGSITELQKKLLSNAEVQRAIANGELKEEEAQRMIEKIASEAGEPTELMTQLDRVEGEVKAASIRRIAELIDNHPEEAVNILRNWIYEGAQ